MNMTDMPFKANKCAWHTRYDSSCNEKFPLSGLAEAIL